VSLSFSLTFVFEGSRTLQGGLESACAAAHAMVAHIGPMQLLTAPALFALAIDVEDGTAFLIIFNYGTYFEVFVALFRHTLAHPGWLCS
jgi:hypothetical protein